MLPSSAWHQEMTVKILFLARDSVHYSLLQVRQDMVEASKGAPLNPEASQRISHLLLTLADVRGVLIKLVDSLAGLRSAKMPPQERIRSAQEALEVFAPIANRLGVWSIKAALEDLAFKVTCLSSWHLHGVGRGATVEFKSCGAGPPVLL